MRCEIWKSLCCVGATSVLFGIAGCKANQVKAETKASENGPTTIMISATKEEPAETKVPETSAAESSAVLPESGIVNGLYYHLIPASSSGDSGERGYYVFQDRQDKLSYKLLIAAGEFSTGGHSIEICDIQYDGSKLKITVKETGPKDTDTVIQAITYPCCGIEIDQLPGDIEIVSETGTKYERLDTRLDESELEKGWIAIIQNGAGEHMWMTYVYKTDDGKYKYINVAATTVSWGSTKWNKVVKDKGIVDSREAVVEEAKKFKSDGFVTFAGDASKTVHSIKEFLAAK